MKTRFDYNGCILDGAALEGDTVFSLVEAEDGKYAVIFRQLQEPIGAMKLVTEEQSEAAVPYMSIMFGSIDSFISFVQTLNVMMECIRGCKVIHRGEDAGKLSSIALSAGR